MDLLVILLTSLLVNLLLWQHISMPEPGHVKSRLRMT